MIMFGTPRGCREFPGHTCLEERAMKRLAIAFVALLVAGCATGGIEDRGSPPPPSARSELSPQAGGGGGGGM